MVVRVFQSVQADTDVRQSGVLQALGHLFGDQGPVCGDDRPHALFGGPGDQLEDIRAHEGLATGEQHHWRTKVSQVVDQVQALRRGQFARVVDVGRMRIAMHTLQVAAPPDVPYHHGLLVLGKLQQVRRQVLRLAPIAQGIRLFDGAAIEF